MIKLKDLLMENSTSVYEYGCAMLYFTFDELSEIQSLIDDNDVYTEEGNKTYGLDDEPHTTLLYGIHDDEIMVEDVEEIYDKYTFYTCKAHNPSLFKNDKYDVLKFEMEGDNLHEMNKELKKFPFTSDYPNYNPHLTIGYLKKGMGKKYVDLMNKKGMNEYWLAPQYGVYSQPNGKRNKINILVD